MMMFHSTLSFLFLLMSFSSGQSYYYTVNKGVTDEYNMSAPNGVPILQGPVNDSFSPQQTIPFLWSFYGSYVTQFKASDNGYITFDLQAMQSDPLNGVLPSTASPNAAIYAFWDNLELSNNPSFVTNDIRTYTVGTAPDRVFVIQWHCTPYGKPGNGNYLFFAIRLYEQGDFDILHQQIRLDAGTMSGTVGCENSDGTLGTMVAGSPNITYTGGVYIKENVPVYRFSYGSQVQYDITLKSLVMPDILAINKPCDITGTVINHGTETVMNLEVNYQVDDNPVVTALYANMALPKNGSAQFSHPERYTPTTPGHFETIRVWVTKINGQPDANPSDNSLTDSVFINKGLTKSKHVLIEEFSTAPCGYCPEGQIYLGQILDQYPNVIGVTHHSGYLTDAMTIPASVTIADKFAQGAPTACIDRILWPNQLKVAISRADWERRMIEAAAIPTPVGLRLALGLDPATRVLNIDCTAEFADYPYPGDMRLNVFIVEDSVSKTGSGYDQTNYYNTTTGHPLFGKGDPIIGYVHKHVLRAVPTGVWGQAGLIPASVSPGEEFTGRCSYTLPPDLQAENVTVIGFVSYERGAVNDILNAASIKPLVTSIHAEVESDAPATVAIGNIYPHPVMDRLSVEVALPPDAAGTMEIVDWTGRNLGTLFRCESASGRRIYEAELPHLHPGTYFLRLRTRDAIATRPFLRLR